jgi:hypothetical protein
MPLSEALDRELDAQLERARQSREAGEPDPGPPGEIRVEADGYSLEAEVVDCERIGATLDRLRVRGDRPGDVRTQAHAIAERMHGLGERVEPVEVEPSLGGAVLRTKPEDMVEGRFYEINVGEDGRQAEIERFAVGEQGQRERQPFTVTRENLGRVVDGLAEGLGASGEAS